MNLTAIRTRIFHQGDDLISFITKSLGRRALRNGDILAVTSKIVSLSEGSLVSRGTLSKRDLILRESDEFLGEVNYGFRLSIKHGLLCAAAGIDESNSEFGDYILLPRKPYASAKFLWEKLRRHYRVSKLGIILTDSRSLPLRRGIVGQGLAHFGFDPVRDFKGQPDIFGRKLKMTQVNLLDALAASAVLEMGEASERKPLVLIRGASVPFSSSGRPGQVQVPWQKDIYLPLLKDLIGKK